MKTSPWVLTREQLAEVDRTSQEQKQKTIRGKSFVIIKDDDGTRALDLDGFKAEAAKNAASSDPRVAARGIVNQATASLVALLEKTAGQDGDKRELTGKMGEIYAEATNVIAQMINGLIDTLPLQLQHAVSEGFMKDYWEGRTLSIKRAVNDGKTGDRRLDDIIREIMSERDRKPN